MKNIDEEVKRFKGKVPENAEETRDRLLLLAMEIDAGRIKQELAKEMSNAFGKAIKSATGQIEFAIAAKTKPKCKFYSDAT